jgi:hypothetical protein
MLCGGCIGILLTSEPPVALKLLVGYRVDEQQVRASSRAQERSSTAAGSP